MPLSFCPQCNHMLFPNVSYAEGKPQLKLYCRACDTPVDATDFMVFRRVLKADSVGSAHSMPDDIISDPTLPRTRLTKCARCLGEEAVFYQSNSSGSNAMTLYFVCCSDGCGYRWTAKNDQ